MPNISTLLREARESNGITIKEAAKALKLRERHIQMLEDGRINELSKEIYLKGFLKTYSHWLHVDSIDINANISTDKKKLTKPGNNIPVLTLVFSYLSDLARRPGLIVFIISTLLTIGVYFFWTNKHKYQEVADVASPLHRIEGQAAIEKYSNIIDKYFGMDLVLFSHSNVAIKIIDTQTGEQTSLKLAEGDVFFLQANDGTFITSDTADEVEVFIDDGANQLSIGTLDNILMKF
jgi:hypothetical protein